MEFNCCTQPLADAFIMKKPNKKFRDRQVRENVKSRHNGTKTYVSKIKNEYIYCPVPENFCLKNRQSRKKVLGVVQSIQKLTKLSHSLFLDFSSIRVLNCIAVAHFMQVLNKNESKLNMIGAKPSKDPVVKAMLSKLGIHKQLRLPNFNKSHHLVDKWYFCWGDTVDFDERYDEIENALIDNFGKDSKAHQTINNAISEAVANVINHAYKPNDVYKKWLLFFCIDKKDNHCTIVVSDLGKTIPKTIPKTMLDQLKNNIVNLNLSTMKDADLIELATKYKKTQTKVPYRGKGFDDMQLVCNAIEGATMSVFSRQGYFLHKQTKFELIEKENFSEKLQGTIIAWSIPLTNI